MESSLRIGFDSSVALFKRENRINVLEHDYHSWRCLVLRTWSCGEAFVEMADAVAKKEMSNVVAHVQCPVCCEIFAVDDECVIDELGTKPETDEIGGVIY